MLIQVTPRRGLMNLLLAVTLSGFALAASAQEPVGEAPLDAPPVAAPAPAPVVDPAYLEPLKALSGDEEAFLDQMWTMGNAAFERIAVLQSEMSPELTEAEIQAKSNEIQLCLAQLTALGDLGLKTFDHSASVHNFRGTVYYDGFGKQMEGVKEWLEAVSLDPKYSDPHNNLGMHYFHSGLYELGFQNMDKALELDPKNADYCFNMAQNYLIYRPQTEKIRGWDAPKIYKEAMKLSKKATKLAPDDYEILEDYAVNFIAAENFELKPDWKESTKAWQAAREHAENNVQTFFTWLNEGRAWRNLENKKEARRCFEAALEVIPGNEVATRLLDDVSAEN
jgi:tetratricopeptide (TPR) repeat protein